MREVGLELARSQECITFADTNDSPLRVSCLIACAALVFPLPDCRDGHLFPKLIPKRTFLNARLKCQIAQTKQNITVMMIQNLLVYLLPDFRLGFRSPSPEPEADK